MASAPTASSERSGEAVNEAEFNRRSLATPPDSHTRASQDLPPAQPVTEPPSQPGTAPAAELRCTFCGLSACWTG